MRGLGARSGVIMKSLAGAKSVYYEKESPLRGSHANGTRDALCQSSCTSYHICPSQALLSQEAYGISVSLDLPSGAVHKNL